MVAVIDCRFGNVGLMLGALNHFGCKAFLHGPLVVKDNLTMDHGLEMRVPFLDNDLVDFAMRLPVRTKLRDLDRVIKIDENEFRSKQDLHFGQTNDGKLILRHMLKRYLPEDYVVGVKQGFSGPDASWFRGESMDYVRRLVLDPKARIYEFLRPDTVKELVEEHLEGHHNHSLFIWSLLCFEWWCRVFLELLSKVVYGLIMRRRGVGVLHLRI